MAVLILVVGNSGIGKTTFTRRLAEASGFAAGYEDHAGRPFQERFAGDLQRYALANQVDYLLFRAEQERLLRLGDRPAVQDGGLEQDFFVFTRLFYQKGYLQPDEFDLCRRLYHQVRQLQPPPDLILRLAAPLDVVLRRFARRGRPLEIARRADLNELETLLHDWLNNRDDTLVKYTPVIEIDASADDPGYSRILPALLDRLDRWFVEGSILQSGRL